MSLALITGANGFIGSNLAKKLIEKGWDVKGLVLKGTSTVFLDNLDVEIIYGDVTQPDTLIPACKNIDVVFHLAALAKDWGAEDLFFKVNSEGTKNLLDAAVKNDVNRFVLMSSVAVHNYSGHYKATEETPRDCPNYLSYGISKIKAENFVNEFQKKNLIEGVIIRPGLFPFGPNDITSFSKLADALMKGMFAYVNGGKAKLSTAYVENLCHGIELAGIKKQAVGQTYIISDDEEISWKSLIEKFCNQLEVKPPNLSIPHSLGKILAIILEKVWLLFKLKGEPPVTEYRVNLMYKDLYFISDKAKKELGYSPVVSLDEGIIKTVEWFKNTKEKLIK